MMLFFVWLFLTAFVFISHKTIAQTVELTAAYGYQFGSKSSYGYNNYVKIKEGDQYSFTLGVDMFEGTMTEVTWVHQSSEVLQRDQITTDGLQVRLTDVNMDWIMVGASKYITKDKLRPFLGGGIGAAIFTSNNENQDYIQGQLDRNH